MHSYSLWHLQLASYLYWQELTYLTDINFIYTSSYKPDLKAVDMASHNCNIHDIMIILAKNCKQLNTEYNN